MSNEKVRFSVRFNLNNKDHLKAWKLLSVVSNGNRSSFCIKAILNMESKPNKNDLAYQIRKSNQILGKMASTKLEKRAKRKKKQKSKDITIIVKR